MFVKLIGACLLWSGHLLALKEAAAFVCPYPELVSEPSLTDIQLGTGAGDLLVWDGNPLCNGTSVTETCKGVGKAYGVCTLLSNKNEDDLEATPPSRDCVDNFVFNDELNSTLIMRAVEAPGVEDSVVVGGTGCYWGASGTVWSIVNEANVYVYNLTYVVVPQEEEVEGAESDSPAASEKSGVRHRH